jgi:glycosyltransferase involved in cell wall biosynthesis
MLTRLHRTLAAFKPDLVHLQGGHLWFNISSPFLGQYPLVVTMHDPRHHPGDRASRKTPQAVMDLAARRADQVIVHGEALRKAAINEVGLVPGKVSIVPPVPDLLPSMADGKGHSEEEENLVLFFGRIWKYKGLEYLIRAAPLITAAVPSARIMIAGAGEQFDRYERLMQKREHFIVENEYIPDEKVGELFTRASVVALPYTEASMSGVILLAYLFARPVVATSVGMLPEMVEDGITGYIVPPRDDRVLAEVVVRLLRDAALRRRMGAAGRRRVETLYGATNVAECTLAAYSRAIRAHAERRSGTRGRVRRTDARPERKPTSVG